MRSDLLYRQPCCGLSLTVGGAPNGDEAFAEEEVIRTLRSMCRCAEPSDTVEKKEVNGVLYGYQLASSKSMSVADYWVSRKKREVQ